MDENLYFRKMLQSLNAAEVEYLIVGRYAIMKYGEPRFTKDLDIWVGNSSSNAAKLFQALAKFGAPLTVAPVLLMASCQRYGRCRNVSGDIRVSGKPL